MGGRTTDRNSQVARTRRGGRAHGCRCRTQGGATAELTTVPLRERCSNGARGAGGMAQRGQGRGRPAGSHGSARPAAAPRRFWHASSAMEPRFAAKPVGRKGEVTGARAGRNGATVIAHAGRRAGAALPGQCGRKRWPGRPMRAKAVERGVDSIKYVYMWIPVNHVKR